MNDKNLIPNSERTPSELREITSKGGKKSGESRRRKKTMKQVMDMLLGMPANTPQDWQLLADLGFNLDELDEDTVNNILIVNAALLKNAKQGDVASIKELSEKLKDERIMTAKDRQVLLSDIARDDENEPSDRIKAVDTLNKMTGEYTVKVDAKVEQSEKLADVFKQLGGEELDE